MFKVHYMKGEKAGTVKTYMTAGTAGRPVHRYIWPILGMGMSHKIDAWMTKAEQEGKPKRLTVGDTLQVEYLPT